jgi:hypothetical protein
MFNYEIVWRTLKNNILIRKEELKMACKYYDIPDPELKLMFHDPEGIARSDHPILVGILLCARTVVVGVRSVASVQAFARIFLLVQGTTRSRERGGDNRR